MKLKISYTVTNDLSQDQRMNRICSSVEKFGHEATLIGRKRPFSLPLTQKSFKQHRLNCFFQKGKLFYLEYNIRLFFYLLFSNYDAFCAIDLDTMLPNYWAAKIKSKPLIYDAHEYFTELEEVVNRPLTKKVWKWIEKTTVPHIKYAYTVSEGYKNLFEKEYHSSFNIVRNATILKPLATQKKGEPYILYQGAVNFGRGLEELIKAIQQVDCKLIICGKGDVLEDLKKLTNQLSLNRKVKFKGFLPPEKLIAYTQNATIGISLFANKGLSNQFSLANRFFDYMHAGVPQLAMEYPEYISFNKKWEIACLLPQLNEKVIAEALNQLLTNTSYYNKLKKNSVIARETNCWQEEEKSLFAVYQKLENDLKK